VAKKIKALIKLNLAAGEANPGPPAGPVLGQYGVPIMEFINKYNETTKDQKGSVIPVVITVYEDRTFTFITKLPPTAEMIKKKLGLEKGAKEPKRETAGKIKRSEIEEIAKEKMKDMNTDNLESAIKIVAGTARSMGVEIEE